MKRKLLSFVLILSLLFLAFSGCTVKVADNGPEEEPGKEPAKGTVFMWEVRAREGSGKLYLLGSIHVGRADMFPLSPTITNAFENSDALAVECDVTTLYQRPDYLELMEKVMYTDGTTIRDHIPEDLYEKVDTLLKERGLSIKYFSLYKPIILSQNISNLLLEEWGYSSDNGIDVHFINLAREKGMEIIEIESVDFQLDLLGGFPDKIQVLDLKETVEDTESYKEAMENMFSLWTAGDVERFEELIFQEDTSLTAEEKELYREYEKQMFDDRNYNMAAKAEEYLKTEKTIFFVVGSGHMVGETGVVKLLRDRGYEVVQK